MSNNNFLYYEKKKLNPTNSGYMYYTINNKIVTINSENFSDKLQPLIINSI